MTSRANKRRRLITIQLVTTAHYLVLYLFILNHQTAEASHACIAFMFDFNHVIEIKLTGNRYENVHYDY
jgi:hypothetical protein